MFRNRVIVSICAIAGVLFLARIWWMQPSKQISRALRISSSQGIGNILDFSAITPFRWQQLFIFPPYTSHQRIELSLGSVWPAVASTSIESNDGVVLLVFLHDKKVVCWLEHSRGYGDFETSGHVQVYNADNAKFWLHTDHRGWSRFKKVKTIAQQDAEPELPSGGY